MAPADVEVQLTSSELCQQLQHWPTKHGAVVIRVKAHHHSARLSQKLLSL
jgi:hypothetical protein